HAAEATRVRLAGLVDRLHDGAPMPANGIQTVCDYCKVRGLCRRDFWADTHDIGERDTLRDATT
ncbi:MAG: hypothetical protein H7125_08180, partial [Proteobacteria bacterium]|nr:hypothetical protein [Burkholderiales bacterium]